MGIRGEHCELRLVAREARLTFLPLGWPESVAPGYGRFTAWQLLHHFTGATAGVVAAAFMLYAVGLGVGAVPVAGAVYWSLKDVLGQVGTLLGARHLSASLGAYQRQAYAGAVVLLGVAALLEVATWPCPGAFLPLAASANALIGLAFLIISSCSAAFHVAFSRRGNIGDVTAKATSQGVAASLVATATGTALVWGVGQSTGAGAGVVALLSGVSVLAASR